MCNLSLFQRSNILSVFAGVLLFAAVSGCGGRGSSGDGGILPSSTGTALTVDNAGVIPVFGNTPTSTVVYVHNNSGTSISGISYSVVAQNNAALSQSKSKFLNSLSAKNSLLNSDNVSQCSTIAAGQSCPLSITTPVLSGATTQGSLEIKASYTQNNKVISFTQLISYAQVQNNLQASGAKFQAGVSISGNGNSVGYGTIYLYGSGQNQIYDVSSIIINKSAIKVVNGNISGQQIQSNFVQAVEISSPISDSSVSATIMVNSSISVGATAAQGNHSATKSSHTILKAGNSLLAGDQFSNSVDIVVAPANAGAILTTGFVPLINTVNGTSGSLLIHNSGDQTAAVGAVSAGSGISNLSGCSNSSLPANASCTITFNVTESGGSANITVPYTGGSAGSVAANVTWFNGASAPLVSMSSSVDPISFPATENGSTTITVTNIGGYILTNVNIPAPVVVGGSATATLGTNNCSGIRLLPVGGSCEYVVNVTDSQTDLGQQINVGFSASYTGVDGTKEYSRILPINYSSTANGAVLSLTPATADVAIIGNSIDSTTQVLTLSNSGNLPATITSSVLSDNPSFLVESSTTCGPSLASGASCVYNLQLGPTLSPVESSGVSRYTINYTANGQAPSGSVTSQVNWSLQGYEQSISLTAFAAVGESAGNGLSGTPFIFSGSSSSPKKIELTYKNTGTDPTIITAIQESNPTYTWVVANDGDDRDLCSNVPLQPNDECKLTYINVLYQSIESLGSVGATYTENFTVPALTYQDISIPSLQSNSQPNVPGGGVTIYAQSNQATLANTLTVYESGTAAESVVVTNLLANAAGYTDVFVISTMEDYLVPVSSDPYSPTCASDSSNGALTQSCTLSQNMLLGTGTYLVNQSSLNPNTDLILNAEFSTNVVNYEQVLSLNTTASANLGTAAPVPSLIFVTTATYKGGFILESANNSSPAPNPLLTNGLAAGDYLCNLQAATDTTTYPGSYKALLAGTNRIPGGSDWVLQANKSYINQSGDIIATTDADAKLPATLTHPIASAANEVWSGFDSNWGVSDYNCGTWASGNSDNGGFGMINALNYTSNYPNIGYLNGLNMYSDGPEIENCYGGALLPIYCVQQP